MNLFVAGASHMLTDHRAHGEGLIAWNILERLGQRGHTIVACSPQPELSREPSFEVVRLESRIPFPSLRGLALAQSARRALRSRAETFDAVLWIMPQGRDHLLWPFGREPLVIGPLALEWGDRGRPRRVGDVVVALLSPLTRALHRRTLRRASAVLLSLPEAASIVPRGARATPIVVPFGVDVERFTPTALPDRSVVAFVGSLERKKGVRDLVDAFRIVRGVLPDAKLIMAGEGPEREWIELTSSDPVLRGGIELLGRVPHDDVPAFLGRSSVVCLPAHGEPFGLAVIEAMAAARAVVAVDRAGPRHLVGTEGGRLVPPGDVDALATSLVTLLSDRAELERIGRHNRRRAESELSWDVVIDRIETTLCEAILAQREATTRR